jgi:hypothetical protein
VQVFHGSGAKDDEEPHPEGGSLKGNGFIVLSFGGLVVGFEDDRVEKEGKKTQYEKQLDHEHHEVFGMVLDPVSRLRQNDLIDVVEIHAARKQEYDQQNAGNFFVVPIKNVGDGLDLIFGNGFPQSWRHRHDEKRQPADPNDRGEQVKPVVDDRNEDIEIGGDALKSVHFQGPLIVNR